MAEKIYRYFSDVRAVQIKDEINGDIDFAAGILEDLAEKYPFMRFRLHVDVDQEEAEAFINATCYYTTNIKYDD